MLSSIRRARIAVLCLTSACFALVVFASLPRRQHAAKAISLSFASTNLRLFSGQPGDDGVIAPTAGSITVNSTSDEANGTDGFCTLREAITAANNDAPSGVTAGECSAGSGDDTINFSVTGTINLTGALPNINSNVTINGPGSSSLTVRRDTGGDYRIFTISGGQTVSIAGLVITNGKTADGAAGGTMGGNALEGGGVSNLGTLTMTDVSIVANRTGNGGNATIGPGNGGNGGGIYNQGNLTMTNCTVTGNSAGNGGSGGTGSGGGRGGDGGGIYGSSGNLTLVNVTISNNTGGASTEPNSFGGMGGGIYTNSPVTTSLTNCGVSGNSSGNATGPSSANGFGGGIQNGGALTVVSSTISGNTSKGPGGGIINKGALTLVNSTISGNSGDSGGGINNDITTNLSLTNCTITNNVAIGFGSGVLTYSSNAIVKNTIIAGNGSAQDVNGTFVSQGFNLVGNADSGAGFNAVGDQFGTTATPLNARLGPLANNGGPTQTHALLAGSPALDAGNNSFVVNPPFIGPPFTDQRGAGFARIVDGPDANTTDTVDIGAFEAQVSVADIADTSFGEDGSASFQFDVGGSASITSVVATSSNTTLVPNNPANLSVTGSGSSRTLTINPVADQFGTSTITVTVNGTNSQSMSDTFLLTVNPVADTPSVTPATTNEDTQSSSGLVISRNAIDGTEVTHFKITNITNGTLFKNNGTTQINNNDFITFAEGNAGLKFTPAANLFSPGTTFGFQVQGATSATGAGLGSAATAAITVNPVADTPTVTSATTTINKQSTAGLVISRNAADGAEVTHFKITNIQNGTLFKNDGTTQIANGAFITFAEGNAGLKFTPGTNLFSPGTTFGFQVQAATSGTGNGLSGAATASITVTCVASSIVTNTNDSGAGSLRDAIINACPGGAIGFNIPTSDPGFNSTTGVYTITLTSGELTIDRNLAITGLGPNILAVKRSAVGGTPRFRIFTISAGTVAISGVTITNGLTADGTGPTFIGAAGGGILNNGTLTLSNSNVNGNGTGSGAVAAGAGGGIFNSGTLIVTGSTVSGNQTGSGVTVAGSGGGIQNTGVLTLTNTAISGNQIGTGSAGQGGSAIQNSNGTLTMTGGSIAGNSREGLHTDGGTVALNRVSIVNNSSSAGGAGLLIVGGTTNISNCLISNNVAGLDGGGIRITSSATVTMVNTTISGNSSAGAGGGVEALAGTIGLNNVTITNNRSDSDNAGAERGGGLDRVVSQLTLKNTIIAGNFRGASPGTTPDDFNGIGTTDSVSSFNLIGTCNSCGLSNGTNNNQVGVSNPGLGPLANNGGPTQTHALLAGSPALDAGSNANLPPDTLDLDGDSNTTEPIPFDQRGTGFSRVVDGPDADAIATVDIGAFEAPVNPIDGADFFVRQHYLDFLNRQPDQSGLDFWVGNFTQCGTNPQCIEVARINVSGAFYLSIEFQQTGYLVERIYKAAYGNASGTSTLGGAHTLPVPIVRLNEFLPDTQEIGQGVIVGQPGWETVLENNKQAFTTGFVQRSRFTTAFPNTLTPAQFVDTLNANAGNPLSQSERDQLVSDLATNAKTRAQVLRIVAEDPDLNSAEFNRAFVLMQYFGYLRRNPNDTPDSDYTGYDFWLTKLNQFNGNFQNAEMVKAFISSIEYRQRFGP